MVAAQPGRHRAAHVMITDGDPTSAQQHDARRPRRRRAPASATTADLDDAVTEANVLKALPNPSHMFVVGVGARLSSNAASEGASRTSPARQADLRRRRDPEHHVRHRRLHAGLQLHRSQGERSPTSSASCAAPASTSSRSCSSRTATTVDATGAEPVHLHRHRQPDGLASWQNPRPARRRVRHADHRHQRRGQLQVGAATPPRHQHRHPSTRPQAPAGCHNGQKCSLNNLDGTPPRWSLDNVGANAAGASKPAALQPPGGIGPDQAMNCEVYNRQLRTSTHQRRQGHVARRPCPRRFTFDLKQGGHTRHDRRHHRRRLPPRRSPPVLPGTYT